MFDVSLSEHDKNEILLAVGTVWACVRQATGQGKTKQQIPCIVWLRISIWTAKVQCNPILT